MIQDRKRREDEVRALIEERFSATNRRGRDIAMASARRALTEAATFEHLDAVAKRHSAAVLALEDARAELTGAIIATDAPETALAARAGVTRMTVRKALGK